MLVTSFLKQLTHVVLTRVNILGLWVGSAQRLEHLFTECDMIMQLFYLVLALTGQSKPSLPQVKVMALNLLVGRLGFRAKILLPILRVIHRCRLGRLAEVVIVLRHRRRLSVNHQWRYEAVLTSWLGPNVADFALPSKLIDRRPCETWTGSWRCWWQSPVSCLLVLLLSCWLLLPTQHHFLCHVGLRDVLSLTRD